MNKYRLIRMLLEQAGTPADAGTAGTPPADTAPANPEPKDPAPAPDADKTPAPKDTDKAADSGEKHSLLGGAKAEEAKPADGSAGDNPDGGKTQKPGDGQDDTPQDPYKDLSLPGNVVDEKEMAKYKELAKNLNLKAEDAQRILDFEAERLSAGAAAAAAAWQEQVKQEHGDNLPTVMATCARAIDKLGGNELRDLLDQTGLGNHPILVNAFYKAGALVKEDTSVRSSGTATGDVTFEQALYGRSKK